MADPKSIKDCPYDLSTRSGRYQARKAGYDIPKRPTTAPVDFWSRVDKTESCWLWTGLLSECGTGRYKVGGRNYIAHRWAWQQENGPLDLRATIEHKCGNRRCVRPSHLSVQSEEDRFWRLVERSDRCWLWTGRIHRGYGAFDCVRGGRRRIERAHRYSYELHHGSLKPGEVVMHVCDVRNCVNPDHLRAGTYADNNRDMHAKGRAWQSKTTHCPAGHPYNEQNTRMYQGRRYCEACSRIRTRKSR